MSTNSVAQIVTEGSRVRIVYHDGKHITERVLDVQRVFTHERTGNALVIGYCHRRRETRTFNMQGILAAMADDSTTISTFAMSAAVTNGDTDAFHAAYEAFYAA